MMTFRRVAAIALATGCAMIGACRAQSAVGGAVPAILVDPDPQVISTLAHTVSRALGGRHVLLAPDALTRSSLLVIEPAVHRDLQGRLDSGRTRGMPEKFRLLLGHGQCLLVREATRETFELPGAHCIATDS